MRAVNDLLPGFELLTEEPLLIIADSYIAQYDAFNPGNPGFGQYTAAMSRFNMLDLNNQNKGEDVIAVTFSEFGRKAAENGNLGTDHGEIARNCARRGSKLDRARRDGDSILQRRRAGDVASPSAHVLVSAG